MHNDEDCQKVEPLGPYVYINNIASLAAMYSRQAAPNTFVMQIIIE